MSRKEELVEKYNAIGSTAFYHEYEKLDFYLNLIKTTSQSVSKKLISTFNTFEEVIKADQLRLSQMGLNESQIASLRFLSDINKDLFKKHFTQSKISINCKSTLLEYIRNDLTPYLKNEIGFEPREHFFILYLDSANHVINDKELRPESLFKGTIDRSAIYPREIAERVNRYNTSLEDTTDVTSVLNSCFKLKAKSIIIAHNHPSGNYKPSRSDIELTQSLKKSLALLDIRILDYIIVTRSSYYSFLEENLLE
ncbi:MAG: JAB domain-containing protein [Fusobacteriaceae bacterium]